MIIKKSYLIIGVGFIAEIQPFMSMTVRPCLPGVKYRKKNDLSISPKTSLSMFCHFQVVTTTIFRLSEDCI